LYLGISLFPVFFFHFSFSFFVAVHSGVNHITEVEPGSLLRIDDCALAPLFVTSYIAFNLTFNILVVMILKFGSANIMFMGSTALVPMTNALFACSWIPGHKSLQVTDLVGLAVIMAGICVYRFVRRCPGEAKTPGSGDSDDDRSDNDNDPDAEEDARADRVEAVLKKVALKRSLQRRLRSGTPRKEALYYGLNATTEMLQPLLETRVKQARQRRAALVAVKLPTRNPDTRSPYLSRLGIAPSPRIGASPRFSSDGNGPPRRTPAAPSRGRPK
jgi:hypothetical protein